jgi:diadenosine tetraphosphate (Ap4A) HIT family hydrolase
MISTLSAPWSLHPQLAQDTVPVGDLALSCVLAMNDANYPWLIMVPRVGEVCELIDLSDADRAQLMEEIARLSRALKEVTGCDKLNVAALGNVVAQLHVHVIARRTNDAAWPKPVWGALPARAYAADDLDRFVAAIRSRLFPG